MIQLYVGIPSSYLEQIEAAFVGRTNDAFVEGTDCRIDKLEELGGTFVNRRLDLYDNFDLLITKSIADIKSPQCCELRLSPHFTTTSHLLVEDLCISGPLMVRSVPCCYMTTIQLWTLSRFVHFAFVCYSPLLNHRS